MSLIPASLSFVSGNYCNSPNKVRGKFDDFDPKRGTAPQMEVLAVLSVVDVTPILVLIGLGAVAALLIVWLGRD